MKDKLQQHINKNRTDLQSLSYYFETLQCSSTVATRKRNPDFWYNKPVIRIALQNAEHLKA